MEFPMKHISIQDETDRKSTLSIKEGGILVIGVLPHNTIFNAVSVEDCDRLIEYAEKRKKELSK